MVTATTRTALRSAGIGLASVTGFGAACLGYAAGYEVRAFVLRRLHVPVLPAGTTPIRVLHISDLHLTPEQRSKQRWVAALADLEPDLVVNTGDNLGHPDAVPFVRRCLSGLLGRPGVFCWGSNDFYKPKFKNPLRYLTRPNRQPRPKPYEMPWQDLQGAFTEAGWADLTQRRRTITIAGTTIEFRGTNDGHLNEDRYGEVAGPPAPAVDVALGVTHAPYQRLLSGMTSDGLDLILAGHTHGGQVCIPGYGALVSNCDLSPRLAKGLSEYHAGSRKAFVHVSAGLGTSPYAPIRFACRPEATLLTLMPQ